MGAVHNKINISVTAEAVRVHTHRNCFRPRFVIVGNASIKIFLTHGISKDIEYPLISKLFYYLFYTCRIKPTWCCTIKVDIENSKGQYIEKDKQEATKDGSESTKIQHGI